MRTRIRVPAIIAVGLALLLSCAIQLCAPEAPAQSQKIVSPSSNESTTSSGSAGELAVLGTKGAFVGRCPLEHTAVACEVSGYVARVTVKQTFGNPFKEKIEAIYTFPLPESGAVDDMVMKVGSRTIRGRIERREEAKKIYERAKELGQVAALLDQERPNIFTQAVANIKPGEKVEVTLQYVELLRYENGSFSFAFPTVVGPRFNPGAPVGQQGTGWSADTTSVPDASRITPPVTREGTRAGHDISIAVSIDAGVPIGEITSKLHEVTTERGEANRALVTLKNQKTIPNKDFVLSWQVATDQIQSGYLAHRKKGDRYFTIMLLPPKRVAPDKVSPKEMIFVVDRSGSQMGAPIEKAKETLDYIVDHMNPQDTFQILCFSNSLEKLFDKPEIATAITKAKAHGFIKALDGRGGTWMAPAVEEACAIPADKNRLRIVTFMTDGYVGNDIEIIGLVKKLRGNSRWFPFGTGNSVNRFLIDAMATEGGGEPEYVLLNKPGLEVAKKFYEKISSPVLTDVGIKFEGLQVSEVFPSSPSDVWAQRPIYIKGRYHQPGKGKVVLTGFAGGKPYRQELVLNLPASEPRNDVIASVWARAMVDSLMANDYAGLQRGELKEELKEEVVRVALAHHIVTPFTSFVAVEERVTTEGGKPKTVAVPVEMPEGVSYEGIFGQERAVLGNAGARFKFAPNVWNKALGYSMASGAEVRTGLPIATARAMGNIAPYRSNILATLQKHWKTKYTGTVGLELTINKSGAVESAKVSQSSGQERLDKYALWVARNTKFDALPAWYSGTSLTFKIEMGQHPAKTTGPQADPLDPIDPGYEREVLRRVMIAWKQKTGGQGPTIRITLDRNGMLIKLQVVRSSGTNQIDEEARKLLRKTAYPEVPPSYPSSEIDVTIDFSKRTAKATAPFER